MLALASLLEGVFADRWERSVLQTKGLEQDWDPEDGVEWIELAGVKGEMAVRTLQLLWLHYIS
jgi:hypothetical protein